MCEDPSRLWPRGRARLGATGRDRSLGRQPTQAALPPMLADGALSGGAEWGEKREREWIGRAIAAG